MISQMTTITPAIDEPLRTGTSKWGDFRGYQVPCLIPTGGHRSNKRRAYVNVELRTLGFRAPRKKMPLKPAVSKPSLLFLRSVEFSIDIVPERSLLTKNTAPPPSLAWLFSMIVPAIFTVNRLPSQ